MKLLPYLLLAGLVFGGTWYVHRIGYEQGQYEAYTAVLKQLEEFNEGVPE